MDENEVLFPELIATRNGSKVPLHDTAWYTPWETIILLYYACPHVFKDWYGIKINILDFSLCIILLLTYDRNLKKLNKYYQFYVTYIQNMQKTF